MSPKLFAALLTVLAVSASAYKDSDGDGVPDYLDFCEKTPKHTPVDDNGCSRLQLDWDGDGLCNPDRPKYQSGPNKGSYVPVYKNWCVGLDNCMRVPNPEQQRTHKHHPKRGDACFLEGCHDACRVGCDPVEAGLPELSRHDIRVCTTSGQLVDGVMDTAHRCRSPYKPIAGSDYGCYNPRDESSNDGDSGEVGSTENGSGGTSSTTSVNHDNGNASSGNGGAASGNSGSGGGSTSAGGSSPSSTSSNGSGASASGGTSGSASGGNNNGGSNSMSGSGAQSNGSSSTATSTSGSGDPYQGGTASNEASASGSYGSSSSTTSGLYGSTSGSGTLPPDSGNINNPTASGGGGSNTVTIIVAVGAVAAVALTALLVLAIMRYRRRNSSPGNVSIFSGKNNLNTSMLAIGEVTQQPKKDDDMEVSPANSVPNDSDVELKVVGASDPRLRPVSNLWDNGVNTLTNNQVNNVVTQPEDARPTVYGGGSAVLINDKQPSAARVDVNNGPLDCTTPVPQPRHSRIKRSRTSFKKQSVRRPAPSQQQHQSNANTLNTL